MTDREFLERLYDAAMERLDDDDSELHELLAKVKVQLDKPTWSARWHRLDQERPNPHIDEWVLACADDSRIDGAQCFVIHASALVQRHEGNAPTEVTRAVTHWMPLPFPA